MSTTTITLPTEVAEAIAAGNPTIGDTVALMAGAYNAVHGIGQSGIPGSVVDSDGDVWTRQVADNTYECDGLAPRTLSEITTDFSIREVRP